MRASPSTDLYTSNDEKRVSIRESINSPAFLLKYLHILDIVEGRLVFHLFSKMSYNLSTGDMSPLTYCQSHAPTLP